MEMATKSIFATATLTNKPENQDSKGETANGLLTAVLVADGLGSYKYARLSSDSVVSSLFKQTAYPLRSSKNRIVSLRNASGKISKELSRVS
jgi:serine/threonine protein phosphatase PrpC